MKYEEYRLKIEAYTPDTIPMERLAAYLTELATLLGEKDSVHFVRLDKGSTEIVHNIENEAIPKIRSRISAVRRHSGPRDAVRAYSRMNRMLRDDNGKAVWKGNTSEADIIVFPGAEDAAVQLTGVKQRGSLDGEILRVGGSRKFVPVLLRSEGNDISGCYADREIAKELAKNLFEPVRIHGIGRWNRNDDGIWSLETFKIESFEQLRNDDLSQALNELRNIATEWDEATYNAAILSRNPPEGTPDGSL